VTPKLFPEARVPQVPRTDAEVLSRLAADPKDAEALIAMYEIHRAEFNEVAARWFGPEPELRRRAVNEILVAVGKRASTYDPESVSAFDWIKGCANSEARRLCEVFERKLRNRRTKSKRCP
jgi:hypothetical protein